MGIKASEVIEFVEVVRTYPYKYVDAEGAPVRFVYRFREPGQDEINRQLGKGLAVASKDRAKFDSNNMLSEFCEFLDDVPEGFDDIERVQNGDGNFHVSKDTARAYFGQNERMKRFAADALGGLWQAVLPAEYFQKG